MSDRTYISHGISFHFFPLLHMCPYVILHIVYICKSQNRDRGLKRVKRNLFYYERSHRHTESLFP